MLKKIRYQVCLITDFFGFFYNTIPLSGRMVDPYHQKAEYQKENCSALADNVDSINRSHFIRFPPKYLSILRNILH